MASQGTPSPGPNADQNTMSWLGHSEGVIDLVGRLVSIHQHQQQQALQQLEGTVKLQQSGFPVDPKVFNKLVKKAKLPIATDPETLKAWLSSTMDAKSGKDSSSGAKQGEQGGGGQGQMQAPEGATPEHQQAVEMANRIQRGEKIDPGEVMQLRLRTMAASALRLMNKNAATEEKKVDNALTVQTLLQQSLAGNMQARGTLQAHNDLPFNIEFEKWNNANAEQKGQIIEISAGHESEAERLKRGERIGEGLLTSGHFGTPEDAYKAGNVLAAGGILPPDIKSRMKPYSFAEMADQVKTSESLINMGVPPNKLGQTLQAAAAGGLENALPTGMKPLVMQQLELQRTQLGLEGARVGLEAERLKKETEVAARAAYHEARLEEGTRAKADVDQFKSLVEMKKAGIPITDDIIKGAQIKAANALNMDVEEVNTLFHFLTGGTKLEMKPRLTEEGKSTVDKFTGKGNKSPKQSDFQKVIDAVRGKEKEPL